MKIMHDNNTGLTSLCMDYEQVRLLLRNLRDLPSEQRPNLAGTWILDTKEKTVTLENLSISQVCALDVLMCDKSRMANDFVEALDFALEMGIT